MGIAMFCLCVVIILLVLCNKFLPKWFCDKLGWHLAPKAQSFDGASFDGKCPRCNKHVLQDSNGDWFNIS